MTFDDFWKLYPRKIARKPAERIWSRLTDDEKRKALEALPNHLRAWASTETTFIPHATTWLNQARWEDEVEQPARASVSKAWWTNVEDTLAYGRDRGITPRPGEDMATYRARLRAA